jgi:hypothetical protein
MVARLTPSVSAMVGTGPQLARICWARAIWSADNERGLPMGNPRALRATSRRCVARLTPRYLAMSLPVCPSAFTRFAVAMWSVPSTLRGRPPLRSTHSEDITLAEVSQAHFKFRSSRNHALRLNERLGVNCVRVWRVVRVVAAWT